MTNGTHDNQLDHLFSNSAARLDRWRDMNAKAQTWAAEMRSGKSAAGAAPVQDALAELRPMESYFAYPGARLLRTLDDRIADGDAMGTARLILRMSNALLSGSYRYDEGEWEAAEESSASGPDRTPPGMAGSLAHRPYFEALFVSPAPAARTAAIASEIRELRRHDDTMIYEPVMVGSVEDALLATILNGKLEAVVIYDGIPIPSKHEATLLRNFLSVYQHLDTSVDAPRAVGVKLAHLIANIRPELDIYLLTDREVEKLAGDPAASVIRRVFYEVEEPMEVHLNILEGVRDRQSTPHFDNLKQYAAKPISTFHALPIARGKSIIKSNWIRDFGEFYGLNLFLAETSATTGGLDSMLEPTGNIKVAQEKFARAVGADHVFFVTNGTSTSNKMVYQAVTKPGDIVIVDRNCHKSHHYGMVLSGAQPLYVEAFPMTEYSMYGAVPLRTVKQALLDLKAEGRLDKVAMVTLTNCTFDGHIYNTRRVMQECLAIKPDLIFLWDEAWFGFARWSPFLRMRTAMGAAAALEQWRDDPASQQAWEAQCAELGENLDPRDPRLLDRELVPNPGALRVRVYETDSIHKSMSSLRQGSIVAVRDEDYEHHVSAFREAVFIHASTSPNAQIIASLDIARRQMELEGYELVMRAIEVALAIRREVAKHPVISRYFSVLGADKMIPEEFRASGFTDFLAPGVNWLTAAKALKDDEFCLDPTRLTLVCGTAGYDGTAFKNLLASRYNIQLNKTSRNSVLLQSNINNTRSDVASLVKVLLEISEEIEKRLKETGESGRAEFAAKVRNLMEDVPDLPNFSRFHDGYRDDPGSTTSEGNMRTAFFAAYNEDDCEYLPLRSKELDERLANGPDLVSANFVIPYPPGFPIMVPGQIIDAQTIEFMRKLDVKEIHGYNAARGLKLIKPAAIGPR
ncbi:beta-eliminating lyase-related protein [Achromobacter denitrificans]|uniref:beta-eliminating lyase-related protein n=1 Tax=Achromobacter denitrificans TaxID=32002 RepID=UPI0023E3B42C|nr:beta-eliminating lyase-related protein [Achromobacter denitrificans]MDF3852189.1 beta-eliminating lyase-related protein [Achromobacter denitrificans]MDF3940078.1 beta-eliminating lyase-related protein [Achromobacter denitrificans]